MYPATLAGASCLDERVTACNGKRGWWPKPAADADAVASLAINPRRQALREGQVPLRHRCPGCPGEARRTAHGRTQGACGMLMHPTEFFFGYKAPCDAIVGSGPRN